MPGIFFHLAEAKMLTRYVIDSSVSYPFMKKNGWENDLTLGSIVTDAIPREFKYKTHFWHPKDMTHVVIAPTPETFIHHYPNWINEPMLTGYLLHLHLDRMYFTTYLPKHVRFVNTLGKPEIVLANVTDAVLIKTGDIMPVRQFFSNDYMYGDYIRINPYLVEKYHLSMPADYIGEWPVKETDYPTYQQFCRIFEKELTSDLRFLSMKIFDPKDFEAFLERTAHQFYNQYLSPDFI